MQTRCQHEAVHQSFHLHGWGRQPRHACQQWYVLVSIYFSLLPLHSPRHLNAVQCECKDTWDSRVSMRRWYILSPFFTPSTDIWLWQDAGGAAQLGAWIWKAMGRPVTCDDEPMSYPRSILVRPTLFSVLLSYSYLHNCLRPSDTARRDLMGRRVKMGASISWVCALSFYFFSLFSHSRCMQMQYDGLNVRRRGAMTSYTIM